MARKQISGNKRILKMLFQEVVEQIDEEHLAPLIEGYLSGKENIVFVIGENSRGKYNKAAFSVCTVPHDAWKLYPEPTHTVEVIKAMTISGGTGEVN